MAKNDDERGVREVLAAVAGNVAAVPIVIGFLVLGGAVLSTRSLVDVANWALGSSSADGRRKVRPRKGRRTSAPPI